MQININNQVCMGQDFQRQGQDRQIMGEEEKNRVERGLGNTAVAAHVS
jgi:hypothetical protein